GSCTPPAFQPISRPERSSIESRISARVSIAPSWMIFAAPLPRPKASDPRSPRGLWPAVGRHRAVHINRGGAPALFGARSRVAALAHEQALTARQRDLAPARAKRAILCLKTLDMHLGPRRDGVTVPAVAHQRVRRSALDHPLLLLAGFGCDLDVQPR